MKISKGKRLALTIVLALLTVYLAGLSLVFQWIDSIPNDAEPPQDPSILSRVLWQVLLVALTVLALVATVKNFQKYRSAK